MSSKLQQGVAPVAKQCYVETSLDNDPNVFVNIYDIAPITNSVLRFIGSCKRRFVYDESKVKSRGCPGTRGFYHSGIEVHGVEYSYGGCGDPDYEGTGLTCGAPCSALGCTWRLRVPLGRCSWDPVEIADVIAEMADAWQARDYNVLRKNCNNFCQALSKHLTSNADTFPVFINALAEGNTCSLLALVPGILACLPCVCVGFCRSWYTGWCIFYPDEEQGDTKQARADSKRKNLQKTLLKAAEFQKEKGNHFFSQPGQPAAEQALEVYARALKYLAAVEPDSPTKWTGDQSPCSTGGDLSTAQLIGQKEEVDEEAPKELVVFSEKTENKSMQLRAALHLNVAACLLRLGKWQEVLTECNAVLTTSFCAQPALQEGINLRVKALFRKGTALIEMKDGQQALESLREAARLKPQDAGIREKLEAAKAILAQEKAQEKGMAQRMLGVKPQEVSN
eukprot:gnl/MRDRNA2_/MRDRNA2_21872_c0_seq1.p1 gnl/MRDRNA2_/MRDRNA2_21872_c0~~gnl/MRDRNA2_/MRDRNA2_21872_c0_seq1.p1  ORF type:complete len:451 (-),score=84.28 gnl/MRDRNA2_/MRDRNA2_21872_c0_seq1:75-1427(-)